MVAEAYLSGAATARLKLTRRRRGNAGTGRPAHTNAQIARRLGPSEETLRKHSERSSLVCLSGGARQLDLKRGQTGVRH